jgi:hypothetical protein
LPRCTDKRLLTVIIVVRLSVQRLWFVNRPSTITTILKCKITNNNRLCLSFAQANLKLSSARYMERFTVLHTGRSIHWMTRITRVSAVI